jgi:iron-sulfur cluster assembly protein
MKKTDVSAGLSEAMSRAMGRSPHPLTPSPSGTSHPDREGAFPISITPAALGRIRQILAKDGKPILRIGVKGGGCSGYEYVMRGEDVPRESDLSAEIEGTQIVCDPKSAVILQGTTLDYTGNLMGGFSFDNPNAVRSCGCGTSFSLKTT